MSVGAVIATRGLSKDYGSGRGLFGLDLEVRQGEVFGFLGPNGAGKSTTMRLLLDLIKPTAGSARVLGLDTRTESLEIRHRVGFLPGDLALYSKLTGRTVLDYFAQLRGGVDRRARDALVERFDALLPGGRRRVSRPALKMTLRLRMLPTVSGAAVLIAVLLAVGALFPAVGHTIGTLNIPKGVADLLGGADYGTITGWFRSEIGAIYGPLVIAALAITGAAATTAGEEEERILALVLAHPVARSRLVAGKAAAIALVVLLVALAVWVGMISGVALGGGGITISHVAAFALQLAFFGFATGAVALAVGAGTGRRALASGVAAAVGIFGWLINGFAPLVSVLAWLKYFSLFYYYEGHDPLTRGVDVPGLVVLGALAFVLTGLGIVGLERRDLRA